MIGFKNGFLWGGSASSMQTEGAWNEGGKGLTVYDTGETPMAKKGDWKTAIDFYHRYQEDIALMKGMGFNAYRFSLSWARILPDGDGEVNEEGVQFYEQVIDELLNNGIEPIVCLYHFDMPHALFKKYGGWKSRETYDAFVKYAEIVIRRFGSRVKTYLPFNEQNAAALVATMSLTDHRADEKSRLQALIFHHHFMASSAVWHLVRQYAPHAKVGGMINFMPMYPETCKPEDVLAAQGTNQIYNFRALDVFANGEYPQELLYEWKEGKIDPFLPGDLTYISETKMDFLALSYYQSAVTQDINKNSSKSLAGVFTADAPKNPYVKESEWGWKIDPVGMRLCVREMYDRYHLPVFVMECGIGVAEVLNEENTVEDEYRIDYFREHLEQLKLAVVQDGVDLMGFLSWAPIDILSSSGEMSKRYGFVYVDRTNHEARDLKRYKKKSYNWFKQVIESNGERF